MTTLTSPRPTERAADKVAHELSRLLADTYTLYMKTHGYHWNVTGPRFPSLHALFEEQYLELRDAVDVIAERIRAIGPLAPGSYRQLARLTSLSEDEGAPEALTMVSRLAADHEALIATARDVIREAAATDDVATVDLATQRIAVHQKTLWMLRAMLGQVDE